MGIICTINGILSLKFITFFIISLLGFLFPENLLSENPVIMDILGVIIVFVVLNIVSFIPPIILFRPLLKRLLKLYLIVGILFAIGCNFL